MAQNVNNPGVVARRVVSAASLPATCNVGDVYFKTAATVGTYQCLTTNNWTAMGSGSPSPTPGYSPNQILSGCGVEYISGLTFTVGACSYTISGATYSSAQTNETLAAADPTNPRIDLIGVDNTGVVFVITGTAAANPALPSIDPSTQLGLIFVTVAANGTTPSGITATLLYDENVEWTATCSAHLNCASTSNPYSGTKDIEATAAVLGNNFTLVKPAAGTVNLSGQNFLIFYIRSKAKWPSASGNGSNGARTLSLLWLNGSTQVGSQVLLADGTFGFSSSNTTTYQQIAIPISLFGTGSSLVTTLKALVSGNGGTSSFGWYIDEVTLQSGTANPSPPTTANQNTRTLGYHFDGGGQALAGTTTYCEQTPFSGTITGWSIDSDASGSATFGVRSVAFASYTGTAGYAGYTNVAGGGTAPVLSSAVTASFANLNSWVTAVTAGQEYCFQLSSPATIKWANLYLTVVAN